MLFAVNMQVAYVLGQLQHKAASAALSNILQDVNEHPMVRHEAAEALGSIAGSDNPILYPLFIIVFFSFFFPVSNSSLETFGGHDG